MRAIDISFGATALVVVGEALALTIGILIVGRAREPWVTAPNVLLLATDILLGALVLCLLALGRVRSTWSIVAIVLLALTHAARDLELLFGAAHPFCFNTPLLIVNNAKLAGAVVAVVLAVVAV